MTQELCKRIDHDSYYEFVFYVANTQSINLLFDHLTQIYIDISTVDNAKLRLLFDFAGTQMPPIQPIAARVRQFRQSRAVSLHPRTAIIYSGTFVGMLDSLMRTFTLSRETQVRFFTPANRADAIAWLVK